MNVLNRIMNMLAPFVAMGVFLVLLIVGLVVVSYLLIWGALIGLILFAIAYVRSLFTKNRQAPVQDTTQGRVYEHDEL